MAVVTQAVMFEAVAGAKNDATAAHKRLRREFDDLSDAYDRLVQRVQLLEEWKIRTDAERRVTRELMDRRKRQRRKIVLFGAGGIATGTLVGAAKMLWPFAEHLLKNWP
jgi:hypothetical protein